MAEVDTKTKLMDVAETLVRGKGADGFSYADLSSQIGIRKASIHYHFPAKSDLLSAIMARYSEKVLAALDKIRASEQNPAKQLLAFVNIYRDALNDGSMLCLCVAYAVSHESLPDQTSAEMRAFRRQIQNWLEQVLKSCSKRVLPWPASEYEVDAAAILAIVEGAQIAARTQCDVAGFDKVVSVLHESLKRSV